MNGSQAQRGSHGLRRRCRGCKKLRKYHEADGNHGGENHPRRPSWGILNGIQVCGWCLYRELDKPEGLPPPNLLTEEERAKEKERIRYERITRWENPESILSNIFRANRRIHRFDTLMAALYPNNQTAETRNHLTYLLLKSEGQGNIERLRGNRWRRRLVSDAV